MRFQQAIPRNVTCRNIWCTGILQIARHVFRQKRFPLIHVLFLVLIATSLLLVYLASFNFVDRRKGTVAIRFRGVTTGGRLGNIAFEVAALIGIANTLGRFPVLDTNNTEAVEALRNQTEIFPHFIDGLVVAPFETTKWRKVKFGECGCCYYDDVEAKLGHYSDNEDLILTGQYFMSYKYFHQIRPEIRRMLTPIKEMIDEARDFYTTQVRPRDTVVCVHIRRGDYLKYSRVCTATSAGIIRAVVKYFADKFNNTALSIVFMGNDREWTMNLFGNRTTYRSGKVPLKAVNKRSNVRLIFSTPSDRSVDWAFSQSYCDHVVITAPASTFGIWLGYLAKEGAEVYYSTNVSPRGGLEHDFKFRDVFPDSWHAFSLGIDMQITMDVSKPS